MPALFGRGLFPPHVPFQCTQGSVNHVVSQQSLGSCPDTCWFMPVGEQNLLQLCGNQATACKFHYMFVCRRDSILHLPLALGPCRKVSTNPECRKEDPLLADCLWLEDFSKSSSVSRLSDVFSSPQWLMIWFHAPCLKTAPGGAAAGAGPRLPPPREDP